ncbi:MAG: LysM peptidoglycan-binding domain-containing protein [Firmicutes bacterium]|nr:LysM peptidoglycan-binding domain-containing protein [Bacillota bacterium]
MVSNENTIEAARVFCPGGSVYTIQPGDSLFSLARRFNTTVQAIIAANPGINPTNLQLGQSICIPVAPTPGPCPGGFLYTIRAGETFFSIARRFGIAVPALAAANPGVDPNQLRIGLQICVPAPAPQPGPCPGGFLYSLRAGDTFFSLARRFNITLQALISANPGVDPGQLQIGQQVCIPAPAPPPFPCPGGFLYTISPGDTFFSLARRFGVTVDAIIAANPGVDPAKLLVGQQLCIPVPAPPI